MILKSPRLRHEATGMCSHYTLTQKLSMEMREEALEAAKQPESQDQSPVAAVETPAAAAAEPVCTMLPIPRDAPTVKTANKTAVSFVLPIFSR